MTDEQINAAIAEACGWTDIVHHPDFGLMGRDPSTHGLRTCIPYYASDLNAMHEAEQEQWRKNHNSRYIFIYELNKILRPTVGNRVEYIHLLDATARQHAEAFLKTIEKWEETE